MARKTNIEVNGKNYYRVTRTIGHRADGTAIRKQFYGNGINEANQKADEYIRNLKIGLFNDNQLHTINTLLPIITFPTLRYPVIGSAASSWANICTLFAIFTLSFISINQQLDISILVPLSLEKCLPTFIPFFM